MGVTQAGCLMGPGGSWFLRKGSAGYTLTEARTRSSTLQHTVASQPMRCTETTSPSLAQPGNNPVLPHLSICNACLMRQGLLLPVLRSPELPTAPHVIHGIPALWRSSSSPPVSRPGILLLGCSWCSSYRLVPPRRQLPSSSSSRLLRPGEVGGPAS